MERALDHVGFCLGVQSAEGGNTIGVHYLVGGGGGWGGGDGKTPTNYTGYVGGRVREGVGSDDILPVVVWEVSRSWVSRSFGKAGGFTVPVFGPRGLNMEGGDDTLSL